MYFCGGFKREWFEPGCRVKSRAKCELNKLPKLPSYWWKLDWKPWSIYIGKKLPIFTIYSVTKAKSDLSSIPCLLPSKKKDVASA